MIDTDRVAAVLRGLTRECAALEAFVALLEGERAALQEEDAAALADVTARKLRASDELAALAAARTQSLDAAGYPAARGGLRAFAAAHAPALPVWQRLQQLAEIARTGNRAAGHLVDLGLTQTARALAIVRQQPQAALYSPNGRPDAPRGARVLATA